MLSIAKYRYSSVNKINRVTIRDSCIILLQSKADSVVIFPLHRTVKLFAENTDQPIYFYVSSYQGRYSFVMWNETTPYGI